MLAVPAATVSLSHRQSLSSMSARPTSSIYFKVELGGSVFGKRTRW